MSALLFPAGPGALGLSGTMKAGAYLQGQQSVSTSAFANNLMRMGPMYTPVPFHISAVGAEYSAAGNAGSVFRIGGYTDDGTGYPNNLLIDAGTMATDGTPGVTMINLASAVQVPVGISWWGGATQNAPTTLPTIRTGLFNSSFMAAGNTVPASGGQANLAYAQTSVTGGLPATFAAFPASSAGASPRIILLISSVP